jgi:hypothetical protein
MFARHSLFHHVLEPPEQLHYLVTCNCSFLKKPLLEVEGLLKIFVIPVAKMLQRVFTYGKRVGGLHTKKMLSFIMILIQTSLFPENLV